uniref:UL128 n=1 Tax=Macrostomum lignano TaxID=282301 RepID=A0A1I8JN11_9PLAT
MSSSMCGAPDRQVVNVQPLAAGERMVFCAEAYMYTVQVLWEINSDTRRPCEFHSTRGLQLSSPHSNFQRDRGDRCVADDLAKDLANHGGEKEQYYTFDKLGPVRVGLDGVADARVSEVQHAAGAAGRRLNRRPGTPSAARRATGQRNSELTEASVLAVDRTDVAQPQDSARSSRCHSKVGGNSEPVGESPADCETCPASTRRSVTPIYIGN